MKNGFKLEIVNPEKSFLSKENVSEVVVPAYEGEMGILKKKQTTYLDFLEIGKNTASRLPSLERLREASIPQ